MRTYYFVILALACGVPAVAQFQRPRAEVTPVAQEAGVTPGSTLVVSLKVRLPKDVHVQADKPRDPSLIPTSLTIDPPEGVAVEKITYPAPTEIAQAGRREKLLVFGPAFEIEARVSIGRSVAPGELMVPARLRYQACNDTMCFPPSRAEAHWTLRVVDRR